MIKQIVEYGKLLATLTRDVQQCKLDIKEDRQHNKEQDQRIDKLTEAVQELTFALQHDRDMSARARENLLLRPEQKMNAHELLAFLCENATCEAATLTTHCLRIQMCYNTDVLQ